MRKLLCYVYETMADFEVSLACTMVACNKHRIVPVGTGRQPVTAISGLVVTPSATLDDALHFDDVDGLLIPGGTPGEQPPALTQLVRKLNEQGKLLAAICAGPKARPTRSLFAALQAGAWYATATS